jgi:hypothetical protein
MLGVAEGGVGEERAHGRQAVVPGAGAVVAHFFEVLQERSDERGVKVCHVELGGSLVGAFCSEAQ